MEDLAKCILKKLRCFCSDVNSIEAFSKTIDFAIDNNYESVLNVGKIKN